MNHPIHLARIRSLRPVVIRIIASNLLFAVSGTCLFAQLQQTQATASPDAQRLAEVEQRLNEVTITLTQTQQVLEKSLAEVQQLRAQLQSLHAQIPANSVEPPAETATVSATPQKSDLESIREEQQAMQAEIKQHDQTKVETVSKYPVRITGLALFNAFSNAGVVDNVELPTLALPRFPGGSHGSAGATLRQTLLTLQAAGPELAGARSTAAISADFFGGSASNIYGYNSTAGVMRMRQARAALDWQNTTVEASFSGPFISPLSPTSYATVAQPALSGSGNLWTWSPQLRVEQRVPFSSHAIAFEGGFIDPQSPGYTAIQLDSPVEASRRPGYEGRISYRANNDPNLGTSQSLSFGVGAYSSSQFYSSSTQIHSWAVTGDWRIPIKRVEVSGEIYRGRALGGLGGGAYKDTLIGQNPVTGLTVTKGVDAAGGWSQLKLRFSSTIEANAMFGLDDAFSSNFDGIVLPPSTNPLQLYARNSTIGSNLIFRPKTYLIFSPEYRHIESWRYTGPPNIANIYTLTAGYQF
ncbi:hypothetical protein GCM10011507_04850 [Edaphobacter acidisoli]|uniref:Uncharacterized protein n=1 Tax=Edaphobacter acidisoli TaxID=2040573 RepID=A0A916W046_9BACT|nr:hypothetical protein [Edaphobacter acidisoli]GGA56561.1 hypothetical protein GCM10011507_04850 [Edaphobacter acidisoli]